MNKVDMSQHIRLLGKFWSPKDAPIRELATNSLLRLIIPFIAMKGFFFILTEAYQVDISIYLILGLVISLVLADIIFVGISRKHFNGTPPANSIYHHRLYSRSHKSDDDKINEISNKL